MVIFVSKFMSTEAKSNRREIKIALSDIERTRKNIEIVTQEKMFAWHIFVWTPTRICRQREKKFFFGNVLHIDTHITRYMYR